MVERFVSSVGAISIGTGESLVVGVGTLFGGSDREGAQIWVQPVDAAPYRIGTVAAVDPRGIYGHLELPLVHAWNGDPVVDQPYELLDGPAIANGTSQAALYARFTAFLEQTMGLVGNLADEIDFSLVPNNTLFVDSATRILYQWRNGVLAQVYVVGAAFNPRGPWIGGSSPPTEFDKNDLVSHGSGVFISNQDDNVDHEPIISPEPASNEWWTYLPFPKVGELYAEKYFVQGKPSAGELIYFGVFTTVVQFAEDMAGCLALARTAADDETVWTLKRNGVPFATLTWPATETEGVFESDETTFTVGDTLEVVAASPGDAALADISIALFGRRDGGQEIDALARSGGTMTGAINLAPPANVASATNMNIGAQNANILNVTGNTDIATLGAAAAGTIRVLLINDELTIFNSGNIILEGADDYITEDGDIATFLSLGSNVWMSLGIRRIDGRPVTPPSFIEIQDGLENTSVFFGPSGTPDLYALPLTARYSLGGTLFRILAANDTTGGQNVNTAQPWFPTNGAVAVEANTTYFFDGLLRLSRGAGNTSHTTGILFGGTASLTSIDYLGMAKEGDANDLQDISGFWALAATSLVLKAASTSTSEQSMFRVQGVVRINAAGTFIPQFIYSATPGGAPTILRGSYFRMVPVGDGAIDRAGTWT